LSCSPVVGWAAACGFMIGFVSSKGRHLSDSVVNSHEVGVLRELGDDFSRTHPLSLTCYRSDRHEALFGGSMHPTFDLIERLCEVPYGEALTEMPTPFVAPSVMLTSGVLVVVGLVCGALVDNSSAEMSSKKRSGYVPEGPGGLLVVMKT
jgi:hypothetical protein